MSSLLMRRANRLAFPGGKPGFDPSHPAASSAAFSYVAQGGTFVSLLTGKSLTVTNVGDTIVPNITGPLGPGVNFPTAAGTSYCSNGAGVASNNPANPPLMTWAAIATTGPSFSGTQAIACNSADGAAFYGSILRLDGGPALALIFPGSMDTASTLAPAANTPYFFAVSYDGNNVNFLMLNISTGKLLTQVVSAGAHSPNAFVGNPMFAIGNYVSNGTANSFSSEWGGTIGAVALMARAMPMQELMQWAADPWAFWYPRKFDLGMMGRVIPPGAIALFARAAVMVKARAAPIGAAALAARARSSVRAVATFAGSVALAARARSSVRAAATFAGSVALAARARSSVRAAATFAGSVALAGRVMAEFAGRVIPPGAIALLARAAVMVKARAAPIGAAALAGRTALRSSGRFVPPGAVALIAAAFARWSGWAQASGASPLAGRALSQGRLTVTMTPAAPLFGSSRVTGRGRAGSSASTALTAAARLAARGRGALAANVSFVALASGAAIRSAARAILTRLGVPFTASPRNVTPPALPRIVQVAGEDRSIRPNADGRSIEPGNS
jgi:hypothetical protein